MLDPGRYTYMEDSKLATDKSPSIPEGFSRWYSDRPWLWPSLAEYVAQVLTYGYGIEEDLSK